ncbi:hypothetical protein PG984_016573 [Apiospora sp. TS-2023a]
MTIRETCQLFCQHAGLKNDVLQVRRIEYSACYCLALLKRASVFKVLSGLSRAIQPEPEMEGSIRLNCCTIAALTGKLPLVKLFSTGSDLDPPTFFGRPSWAAAAHGQVEVMRFLLEQGTTTPGPKLDRKTYLEFGQTALGVAAYMGHQSIVQLYLRSPFTGPDVELQLERAIHYAAQGNQPGTLWSLIRRCRETDTSQGKTFFLRAIDRALVCASRRGGPASLVVRVLLDYGADLNETDNIPRSCLQNAARAGDTETVRMLVEAGASCEASRWVRRRTEPALKTMGTLRRDALAVARKRGYRAIVGIIKEAMERR